MAGKVTLNIPRFKKTMAMLGSANEAESQTALRQAVSMCEAANMHLYEALAYAYGGGAEDSEFEERLQRKEAECEQLRIDFQKVSAALQEQLERASRNPDLLDPEVGTEALGEELKRSPRVYVVGSLASVALYFVFYWQFQEPRTGFIGNTFWIVAMGLLSSILASLPLIDWLGLIYQKSGLGCTMLKALGTIGGIYTSFAQFHGDMDPHNWSYASHPVEGFTALLCTALFAVSNLAEKTSGLFETSDRKPFHLLRSWFV